MPPAPTWPDRFLHPALPHDGDVGRRARLTVRLAVALLGAALGYAGFYGLVVGYPAGARILGVGALAAVATLALLRLRPSLRAAGLLLTAGLYGVVLGLVVCEGGIHALALPLLCLPPVVAILLLERHAALAWTALCLVTIAAFGAADIHGVVFPPLYPAAWTARMRIGSPVGLVICTTLLLLVIERMRAEAQAQAEEARTALARLAYRDTLTGLANRARFLERLAVALRCAAAESDPAAVAVLLVDLDGFKGVNDRHGHAAGDALLAQVADRLRAATRGSDTVARLGGDEFAVLLDGVRDDAAAQTMADRILAALSRPFTLPAAEARIGGSIGIARAAHDDVAALLHAADMAMYEAKAAGRGHWVQCGGASCARTQVA